MQLRRALYAAGLRGWRCHYRRAPGKPDLAWPSLSRGSPGLPEPRKVFVSAVTVGRETPTPRRLAVGPQPKLEDAVADQLALAAPARAVEQSGEPRKSRGRSPNGGLSLTLQGFLCVMVQPVTVSFVFCFMIAPFWPVMVVGIVSVIRCFTWRLR